MADDASQQQPTIWKTYVRNLWWWVNPALLKAEASKVVDSRGLLNVKIHRVGRMDRPDKMCSAFVTVKDQQVATELAIGWNGASIPSMSKFQLESSAVGELVPTPRPSTKPISPVQQLWEEQSQQQQPPAAQKKTPVVVPPRFPRRRNTGVDAAGSSTPPSRVDSSSNKKDVAEEEQAKEEKPEAEQREDAELESGEKQKQAKEQDTQEEVLEEKPETEQPEEAKEEEKQEVLEETKAEIPSHSAHGGDDPALPKSTTANPVSAPNVAEKTAESPGEAEEDSKTQFTNSVTEDEEDTASSAPTLLPRTPDKTDEDCERNKSSSAVPAPPPSPPLTLTQCKQESDQESSLEPVAEVGEEKKIRRAESHKKERTHPKTAEKKKRKKKDKEKKIDKRSRQSPLARDGGFSSETSLHHQHYYMKERQQPWDRREALRRERRSYDEKAKKKARWIHVCWSPKKTSTFQRINL